MSPNSRPMSTVWVPFKSALSSQIAFVLALPFLLIFESFDSFRITAGVDLCARLLSSDSPVRRAAEDRNLLDLVQSAFATCNLGNAYHAAFCTPQACSINRRISS